MFDYLKNLIWKPVPRPAQASTSARPDNSTAALAHWANHGSPGQPQRRRALKEDWKIEPFSSPVTSPWSLTLPKDALPTLLLGFRPSAQEEKWFVYADGPDDDGEVVLHMIRSWTGFPIGEVKIQAPKETKGRGVLGEAGAAARITEITWESDNERVRAQTEEKAKSMVREVCRWVLGVQLPEDS